MAVYTTDELVRSVITLPSTLVLTIFIRSASAVIDWLVTQDTAGCLTDDKKELLATWLAAHFAYLSNGGVGGQITSRTIGRASTSYASGTMGDGFRGTFYGQQALLLDCTGKLGLAGMNPPTCDWGGTDEDSERPDRLLNEDVL